MRAVKEKSHTPSFLVNREINLTYPTVGKHPGSIFHSTTYDSICISILENKGKEGEKGESRKANGVKTGGKLRERVSP